MPKTAEDRSRRDWMTVSELNGYAKALMDGDPVLSTVAVRGEISNFKRHYTGHLYFTLKDAAGALKCVMFASSAVSLRFDPRDGDDVIAYGRVSVFPRDGSYQLYASSMLPAGKGELAAAFEALKKKLGDEGLFDASKKKKLPPYPEKIGIVTAEGGAAVKDMLNITGRRFPSAEIYIYPALVQGPGAPASLIAGLDFFNGRFPVDLIIIGRGGGSVEDLFCFNDEALARKIASSRIPVVSAVGHETDFTIADFAADLRAPTPSAAAELAVPDGEVIKRRLRDYLTRIGGSLRTTLRLGETRLASLSASPVLRSPEAMIDRLTEEIAKLASAADSAYSATVARKEKELVGLVSGLEAMNPLSVLTRGYAAVSKGGRYAGEIGDLDVGDSITLEMSGGKAEATVDGVYPAGTTETRSTHRK
ncbi:MAG: exodeoxyribonuclease VII large subunit [Clostridia bacterium]|nr:exodeoxyribonuclease VII large subunit [Clostridia bacterium]